MTDTTKLLDDVLKCKPLYWPTNYEKEILAALRFAKAMQPRPISEAPRDGALILLHRKPPIRGTSRKYNTMIGKWNGNCWVTVNCHYDEDNSFSGFTPLPDQALKEFEEALK